MIPHLKNIPDDERLAKLKLWSLEDRRVRADLTEVFLQLAALQALY